MSWLFILAMLALHILIFRYAKTRLLQINSHGLTLKDWEFYFWFILLAQISALTLLAEQVKLLDIYDTNNLREAFVAMFFITNALIILGYFSKKYRFMIKLSAISTIAVIYFHTAILSNVFASLFNLLF